MRSFAVLTVVLVTACAGAGTTPFALTERATPPALALSTEPAVRRSFPERVTAARLPTADRARLAGTHTADVKLCVGPAGTVDSVALAEPSGSTVFDRAIAADVPGWQFEPYRAPAGLKVCEQFTVSYVGR